MYMNHYAPKSDRKNSHHNHRYLLSKKVDEQHGFALQRSREEIKDLTTQIQEAQYQCTLDKEALVLRAQKQKKKNKLSLTNAEEKRASLQVLVLAAEFENKNIERQLRAKTNEADKVDPNPNPNPNLILTLTLTLTFTLRFGPRYKKRRRQSWNCRQD